MIKGSREYFFKKRTNNPQRQVIWLLCKLSGVHILNFRGYYHKGWGRWGAYCYQLVYLLPRGFQTLIEAIRLHSFGECYAHYHGRTWWTQISLSWTLLCQKKEASSGKEMSTFPVATLYPMYIREYSYSSNLTYGWRLSLDQRRKTVMFTG